MNYFDDILNVYAYLRSQSRQNHELSEQLAKDYAEDSKKLDEIESVSAKCAEQLESLTKELGIEMVTPSEPSQKASAEDEFNLFVRIPKDTDFDAEFKKLVEEAKAAGFTDAHPEDMLSEEEMKHAEEINAEMDKRFEDETKLTAKDISIMLIAAAIRSAFYFLLLAPIPDTAELSPEALPEDIIVSNDDSITPSADKAMEGVNIDELLGGDNIKDKISSSIKSLLKRGGGLDIKRQDSILRDPVPFSDIPDNEYFLKSDILGYDKTLGWLFGVMNIMTDSVTTKNMKTYIPIKPSLPPVAAPVRTASGLSFNKISTPLDLIIPMINNFMYSKESMFAATIKEAGVLGVSHATDSDMATLVKNVENNDILSKSLNNRLNSSTIFRNISKTASSLAQATFINYLVMSIHSVMYNKDKDGDASSYAIRTNKILVYSNAIASIINSTPAILSQRILDMDFGGIIATLLASFNSTKFWIEAKTQFLVSKEKKEIDKLMNEIDEYIEYI